MTVKKTMTVGKRLQTILKKKNVSQYKLSKQTGISQSYISGLISDKYQNPTKEVLEKFSIALNVPISKFLDNP